MMLNNKRLLLISIVAIVLGATASAHVYTQIDAVARDRIVDHIASEADGIPVADLASLTNDYHDLNKASYLQVKNYLIDIREDSEDSRFVYLAKKNEVGQIVLVADSEDPSSSDYSPPGQVYYEASEALKNVFANGESVIVGPVSDRWGSWISGYAPVKDADGSVVAVLGIDFPAGLYVRAILLYSSLPFFISIVLVLMILVYRKISS